MKILLFLTTLGLVWLCRASKPRQGKFIFSISKNSSSIQMPVTTTLYVGSSVYLTIKTADSCSSSSTSGVCWTVRGAKCLGDFSSISSLQSSIYKKPWIPINNREGKYVSNCANEDFSKQPIVASCSEKVAHVTFYNSSNWHDVHIIKPTKEKKTRREINEDEKTEIATEDDKKKAVSEEDKVEASHEKTKKNEEEKVVKEKVVEEKVVEEKVVEEKGEKGLITRTPFEGVYLAGVWLTEDSKNDGLLLDVTLEMKNPFNGYLSASDYPLLTFYMVMCIVYALFAATWLLLSACHYRDLLRVQFWIGGVILLGMIEKAVFYAEYKNVDDTGFSVLGAAKFAEVVSCLKRALARMLVIIVSLGFGIVKPRLGPMLHRVIALGALYFILAVVDAFAKHDIDEHSAENRLSFFTFIPLAVVDSIICWWVCISLFQTMKTLRLRRNVVKLTLYRHFLNTIIFSVVMSIIVMFWSIHTHRAGPCIYNWADLWLETSLWHVLFSVILLVIMILWRPNANNQIYAYSPMIDGDDEDDEVEESLLGGGATESMKLRAVNRESRSGDENQAEADLKWIEENIPQTVADAALPILVDSEDDVEDTKLEMSKID